VKHRLFAITLLLILTMPMMVASAPLRQDQPDIQLSFSVGYNGYFRKGQWTPVRITATNNGGNLDGEVRVRTGTTGGLAETTYRTPIDLPRGARKQIFLYVSLENYTGRVQVEVVDNAGHIAGRETVNVRSAAQDDILYAVVTESPFGAADLSALWPGTGTAVQVRWQLDEIPTLADALAGLDVLMFHDVDTGALTAEQFAAITGWLRMGGHLIVAGGEAWQRTTAGLESVLPVTLKGTVPVDSLAALAADYLRLPVEPLESETTATNNTPRPSARVLVSAGGVPLIVRDHYGAGVVDFVAVDPNSEPLRSWQQVEYLWYALVASVGQQPSWSDEFDDWSMAREATLTTSNTVLPTFLQLCGFLTLYIVLIGPVNYLILKRLNRREWAWFSIPLLIVIFSVLAYSVGFNLRGNVATVNRLTVVRVYGSDEQAQVNGLIGVQSPRRSTYNIAVERGFTLRTLPEIGTGLSVPVAITEGTRYLAEDVPIDAGTIASFEATGQAAAPGLNSNVTWHLSRDQMPRVTGEITNVTNRVFSDAVVMVKGESRYLGNMAPGETRIFDITLGPQDPGPLTLGNSLTQYSPSYFPYSSASPAWCFSFRGVALTVPDVMRNEEFSCSTTGVTPRQQEIRRRYRLLASLVVDQELSGGRDTGVYLFAWNEDAWINVELMGKPQNEEDTTLYIFDLPVTVVAEDERVEIPPGLTTWTIADTGDSNTIREHAPNAFQLGGGTHAAFQFMPMPAVQLAVVDELVIRFQATGPLWVELWNWDRDVWQRIWLNPATDATVIRSPDRFIGPENAVNVRILSQDASAYTRVDYVSVAYRGQLAE
jgi:type II secretory pathway pseudopilin PulG